MLQNRTKYVYSIVNHLFENGFIKLQIDDGLKENDPTLLGL